jgi:hypothetical protein
VRWLCTPAIALASAGDEYEKPMRHPVIANSLEAPSITIERAAISAPRSSRPGARAPS